MTTKTDEQALTPIEPGGAVEAVIDWDTFDLPDDGTGDIKPRFPEIKIVQGTSKMPGAGKNGGAFYFTDTEEFVPGGLDLVFLQAQQARALFADGDAPLCASADGHRPLPGQPLWSMESFKNLNGNKIDVPDIGEPALCAECPFSNFVNGAAPICSRSYITLVDRNANPEDMDLAQLRLSRTSLKPFEVFAGAIKAMKASKTRIGLPLFAFRVRLYTEETTREAKKWYQLKMEKERLTDAELLQYAQAVKTYRGDFQEAVKQTVMASDGEGDAAPAADPGWGNGEQSYGAPRDVTPPADGWESGD